METPQDEINQTSRAHSDLKLRHPRAFEIDQAPWIIHSEESGESGGFGWLANEGEGDCLTAHVCVMPGRRRRDIGSNILNRLLDHARQRGATSIISAHAMPIPPEGSFSTPSPSVRFCRHHGFQERNHIDTFHLDDQDALRLIERLGRAQKRVANPSFSWRFANELEPAELIEFVEANIHLSGRGATPLIQGRKYFPELSPVALTPDGQIAGLAIVGQHTQLRDRLRYHYFATESKYRQTALMAGVLHRSIQNGWEKGWRCSEFRVRRIDSAAMWRFANRNGKWISQLAHFWKKL